MVESNVWRVGLFIALLVGLYLLMVEWDQACSRPKEVAYFYWFYKGNVYASKAPSSLRPNVTDDRYSRFPLKTNKASSSQNDDFVFEERHKGWNETTTELDMNVKYICLTREKKFVRCGVKYSSNYACIDTSSGAIDLCGSHKTEIYLLPLCEKISTREIVTCGNLTAAYLCFANAEELRPLRPCMSKSRRVCLVDDGSLGNCADVPNKLAVLSSPKAILAVQNTSYEGIAMLGQQKRLIQLCRNATDATVHLCSNYSSKFAACLGILDGSVKSCHEIESRGEFGIPVCIQENSPRLVTCEKFSHSNLCMHHVVKILQLIPCNISSLFTCMANDGSLKLCSLLGEHDEKIIFSDQNSNHTLPTKYDAFELKSRSVAYLCKLNDGKDLVECSEDANLQVVCLDLKNGKIDSCKQIVFQNPSIPLCVMGSKKYVVTCGKFNLAPVCLSAEKESSKYVACVNTSNIACLSNRSIESCKNLTFRSQDVKRHSISTRNAQFEMTLLHNVTYFKHKKEVYDAEMKSIRSIMKDRERLCLKKGEPNKYYLCTEQTSIEFACLNAVDGMCKSCEKIKATELGVPLCVKKSREVSACGKYAKTPLCLYDTLADKVMSICVEGKGKRACLSENGEFEPCDSKSGRHNGKKDSNSGGESQEDDESDNKRVAMEDKISKMLNESHVQNMLLCIENLRTYKLVNCDKHPSFDFACLGATKRKLGRCSDFEDDIPIAVCAKVRSRFFITCDIPNKVHLCLSKRSNMFYASPCEEPDKYSCVTRSGDLDLCSELREPLRMESDLEEDEDQKNKGRLMKGQSFDKESLTAEDFTVGTYGPDEHMSGEPPLMKSADNGEEEDQKNTGRLMKGQSSDKESLTAEDFTVGTYGPDEQMSGEPPLMKSGSGKRKDQKNTGRLMKGQSPDKESLTAEDFTVGTYGPGEQMEGKEHGQYSNSEQEESDSIESKNDDTDGNPMKNIPSKDTPTSGGTDEKFYRINCKNCSIDHKFVIVGTPDDVLPEMQVRTFPSEE